MPQPDAITMIRPTDDPIEPHPLAELLPAMSPGELQALRDDIAACGIREPIVLHERQILDGRHRYAVAREIGIDCPARVFSPSLEGSPLRFVYSSSIHRNLTDGQKAAAAVAMNRAIMERRGNGGEELVPPGEKSRDFTGRLFGISGRYIQQAQKLADADRDLFAAVFAGRLPLTRAVAQARRAQRTAAMRQAAAQAPSIAAVTAEIFTGDCLELLATLPNDSVDMVFADPPYNLGFSYDADPNGDSLDPADYEDWLFQRIDACIRVLRPGGTIVILHCEEWQAVVAEALMSHAMLVYRRCIVWHESFGAHVMGNFARTARFLHYAVKVGAPPTFRAEAFTVQSERQRLGDPRAVATGKIDGQVWSISRLQGTSDERLDGFPTQLPLSLLERLVDGFTAPGDTVLDPFAGSGTTAVAALRLGRHALGFERSDTYAEASRTRLAAERALLHASKCAEDLL